MLRQTQGKDVNLFRCWIGLIVVTLCWFSAEELQAGGPENVLLVVNSESEESMAIANHFIRLRNIPPDNVVYLRNIPDSFRIQYRYFARLILKPVVEAVQERGLEQQIDYVIYSSDFPTTVNITPHVRKLKEEVDNVNDKVFRPMASLTSLTYFYTDVLADNPSYMGLDSNLYMRRISRKILAAPFFGDLQKEFLNAVADYDARDYAKASTRFQKLVESHPAQVAARYYLVRSLTGEGKYEEALLQLALCIEAGWCYRNYTENDGALALLRRQDGYSELAERIPRYAWGQLPTRSFSNRMAWAGNGWPNADPTAGKRYALSTMLAITHEQGSTLDQAIEQLKRSAAADSTYPRGTFYFTSTGNVRSKTRLNQFGLAVTELQKMGMDAEVVKAPCPKSKDDVAGATLGAANVNWKGSRSKFLPGAICDNLTSYGGVIAGKHKQTRVTSFLNYGAAGASGTVVEPLAIDKKFPSAQVHVHYARGCTLAEAFYQAVSGPYQLLIVGDPLCKPWANRLEFEIEGVSDGDVLKDDFTLTLKGTNEKYPIRAFELFMDGKRAAVLRPGKATRVTLDDIPDGYHELRIVAVARHIIGTKTSRQIGITVDREGHSVILQASGNGKYQLKRTVPVTVEATVGDRVDLYQNSRKIGSIKGRSGSLSIDSRQLGQGPVTLRAVVMMGDRKISSQPVDIEIVP